MKITIECLAVKVKHIISGYSHMPNKKIRYFGHYISIITYCIILYIIEYTKFNSDETESVIQK